MTNEEQEAMRERTKPLRLTRDEKGAIAEALRYHYLVDLHVCGVPEHELDEDEREQRAVLLSAARKVDQSLGGEPS